MAEAFLGEIRMFGFNFAPEGWAMCNGQLLPINQNQALFSLLGTTYGGNGQTTFALPDMRSRAAMHFGQGYNLGQRGGEESHTVTVGEMPAHTHSINAQNAAGNDLRPAGAYPANAAPAQIYSAGQTPASGVPMSPAMIASVGGSQGHENRQPYLVLSFIIALQGIFPSRN